MLRVSFSTTDVVVFKALAAAILEKIFHVRAVPTIVDQFVLSEEISLNSRMVIYG